MSRHRWSPTCERPAVLCRPVGLDPSGQAGPTRAQARGPYWRRTSTGLYVPATVDPLVVEQRILEQASRLGYDGAVTAWAALRWYGATFFDGVSDARRSMLPVPLVVGQARIRPDPRVVLSQEQVAPTEQVVVSGLRCTTVQRALFDEMRRDGTVRGAVVALDMAAAAGLTSPELMAEYVVWRAGWTGVERVRQAIRLADAGSRSPQESRARLVWVLDAGLPPPLCNVPVFDLSGGLLGYPDLFDPEAGLVGEYDGEDHKDGVRHRADVAREQRFRDHGLEYFELVGGDLQDRGRAVDRMLNARRRARFLPADQRAWTLQPPPWFDVPELLDASLRRRGLADALTHR